MKTNCISEELRKCRNIDDDWIIIKIIKTGLWTFPNHPVIVSELKRDNKTMSSLTQFP